MDTSDATPPRQPGHLLAALLALFIALLPAALFPGDAYWAYDEPELVAIAHRANQSHLQVTHGLAGNFPLPYGPLPAHLHQLLLLISHDPRWLVLIRATACALITALSLIWLARSAGLNPWFVPAVLAAPYLWLFNHGLWDATLAIPLGCCALAAYASFLRTAGRTPLLLCVAACLGTLLVHLQSLPLVIPILVHLLWKQRAAMRSHSIPLAALAAMIIGMNLPYVAIAIGAIGRIVILRETRHSASVPLLEATTGPLRGGMILSGADLIERYSLPPEPTWHRAAGYATNVGYGLIAIGIVAGTRELRRVRSSAFRRSENAPAASGSERSDESLQHDAPARSRSRLSDFETRYTLIRLALSGIALQVALHAIARIPAAPQYLFGTFALHILFAGVALQFLTDRLPRLRLDLIAIAVYGIPAAALTISGIIHVHRDGWTAGTLSPTLSDQIAIARQLNAYGDTHAWSDVAVYQFKDGPLRPHALWSLRLLFPSAPASRPASSRLVIRHRPAPHLPGGKSGRIELIEATTNADIPAGATLVELMPPPDYKLARPKPVPSLLAPME